MAATILHSHGGCFPTVAAMIVGWQRIRTQIEALKPIDQLKSSSAHLTVDITFKLTALSLPLVDDTSLHGNNDVVK